MVKARIVRTALGVAGVAAGLTVAAAPYGGAATARQAGDPQPFVVGGKPASTKQYPWAVILDSPRYCGGTLVTPTKVVTAAHCVAEYPKWAKLKDYRVVAGRDKYKSRSGTVAAVRRIWKHPAYDYQTGVKADVAVLTLTRPLRGFRPLPIARATDQRLYRPGTKSKVLGWGTTKDAGDPPSERLMQADLPVVSDKQCGQLYGPADFVAAAHVCAGGNHKAACYGDSGGPLMIAGRLAGVVHAGPDQCSTMPTIFTQVSAYAPAIARELRR